MDMITIRRKLMTTIGQRLWPILTILHTVSGTSAQMAQEVESSLIADNIQYTNRIMFLKSFAGNSDGHPVLRDWINGSGSWFIRINGGSLSLRYWGASVTNGAVTAGDEFYIINPTIKAVEFDKEIAVTAQLDNASAINDLISGEIDSGRYLVYRKINPTTLSQNDFICGIFGNGTAIGFKANAQKKSDDAGSWTSTSNVVHVYAGDTLYCLALNI